MKRANMSHMEHVYNRWFLFGTEKVYLLCKVLSVLKYLKLLIRYLSTLKNFSLSEYSQKR